MHPHHDPGHELQHLRWVVEVEGSAAGLLANGALKNLGDHARGLKWEVRDETASWKYIEQKLHIPQSTHLAGCLDGHKHVLIAPVQWGGPRVGWGIMWYRLHTAMTAIQPYHHLIFIIHTFHTHLSSPMQRMKSAVVPRASAVDPRILSTARPFETP